MLNRSYREQPARPDTTRMCEWLGSGDVVRPPGIVSSWHNPDHPGFSYPEAAAIWLSWASWRRESSLAHPGTRTVVSVAATLARELAENGSIGREGNGYLFDTCVAVHALARTARAFGPEAGFEIDFGSLLQGILPFLDADRTVIPGNGGNRHWSNTWGIHHVRSAALLALAGRWMMDDTALKMAARIRARVSGEPWRHERTYVHALAYGVEGEILFRALGEECEILSARGESLRLERLQHPDGYVPAWTDGSGGPRADSTAQAVRIWVMVDPGRFESALLRAIGYLAARQSGRGGIEYRDGSGDLNTWVTAFTDQSLAWTQGGADPLKLI